MTVMEKPRSAAVYARISSDPTGLALGVQRQLEDCRKLAADRGWTVGGAEYVDNDVSAFSGKVRPEYERMLADVRDGLRDAVIVYNMDRLTRRPIELEQFAQVCKAAGYIRSRPSPQTWTSARTMACSPRASSRRSRRRSPAASRSGCGARRGRTPSRAGRAVARIVRSGTRRTRSRSTSRGADRARDGRSVHQRGVDAVDRDGSGRPQRSHVQRGGVAIHHGPEPAAQCTDRGVALASG